ncbi:MAG: MFS transporter [Planctomycetes bacterium]|nr:MFS transporter [Planctomycetota bacterium]
MEPGADADASTARHPRLTFAALYLAEGGPIGFIWWALPVWMRGAGCAPGDIARAMAWVAWPWALKFLWAPLVDLLSGRRFGLRGWILVTQALMALTLVPLFWIDFAAQRGALLAALMLHALAAATQDAAIDTLAVRTVPAHARGSINGWMQVGMLAGRSLFGGGAVLLAARWGERAVLGALIGAVLLPGLLAWLWVREVPPAGRARERLRHYADATRALLRRRELWWGFLLASTVGAGFEGLASLAGPLLLDRGASEAQVGRFFLLPAVGLMALGALVGGRLSDLVERRRAVALTQAAAALCVLLVALSAWTPAAERVTLATWLALGAVYFAAGAATASLYGLLMARTSRAVAALQFCTYMAGVNLCYVWSTHLVGGWVDRWGYGPAFAAGALLTALALPLLVALGPERAPAA